MDRPTRSGGRGLAGATVGILEGRMGSELAELVRRHGGVPRHAPALRETPVDASAGVRALLDALAARRIDAVLFLTGVGAEALFSEAQRLGRLDELVAALQQTVNLCRGQKPWMPLKRRGVPISLTVPAPYTTAEVLATLRALEPGGRRIALLHYGERNAVLADTLRAWDAQVLELCLYEWQLPEDIDPLDELVDAVIAGELDAVAFTSQVQVRHLLLVAGSRGRAAELVAALDRRTVVAAVGPTCAAALAAVGVTPHVVPAHPKMGPMVLALAAYLERVRTPRSGPSEVQRRAVGIAGPASPP